MAASIAMVGLLSMLLDGAETRRWWGQLFDDVAMPAGGSFYAGAAIPSAF